MRCVYEDYAHHPTEIAATLRAARTLAHTRLVAVFQPHLYSRTALLAREFGRALALADVVVVLDVYPARERAEDHPGRERPADRRGERGRGRAAGRCTGCRASPTPSVSCAACSREDDLCVVMGAGDVDALGRALVAR